MSEANKALIHRWFDEVWTQGRAETIDELIAPDCILHGLGDAGRDLHGSEGFKEFYRRLYGAFTAVRIPIEDAVPEDDGVAARWVATATHTGDHLGMPATNRPIRVNGVSFTR